MQSGDGRQSWRSWARDRRSRVLLLLLLLLTVVDCGRVGGRRVRGWKTRFGLILAGGVAGGLGLAGGLCDDKKRGL